MPEPADAEKKPSGKKKEQKVPVFVVGMAQKRERKIRARSEAAAERLVWVCVWQVFGFLADISARSFLMPSRSTPTANAGGPAPKLPPGPDQKKY